MTKEREREIFDFVFAGVSWDVTSSEAPDFLCYVNSNCVLGVEITEFFSSESAARLQLIPNYAQKLIESRDYRHRDDVEALVVDNVTYTSKAAPNKPIPLKAVIYERPSMAGLLESLTALVESKSKKHQEYLSKAPLIDLIIFDTNSCFAYERFEDFHRRLSRSNVKQKVIASPFREIFLVTHFKKEQRYIPLRACAFGERVLLFLHGFRSEPSAAALADHFYDALATTVVQAGFSCAKAIKKDNEFGLACATIDIVFKEKGPHICSHAIPAVYQTSELLTGVAQNANIECHGLVDVIRAKSDAQHMALDFSHLVHTVGD